MHITSVCLLYLAPQGLLASCYNGFNADIGYDCDLKADYFKVISRSCQFLKSDEFIYFSFFLFFCVFFRGCANFI